MLQICDANTKTVISDSQNHIDKILVLTFVLTDSSIKLNKPRI